MNEVVSVDAERLLNTMYDTMIVWNIKGAPTPLRLYLGMTPEDYLSFMNDPESWATLYVKKLYKTRSAAKVE